METVGLRGIWGLEQLDKTGIATWKLGLSLLVGAGVIGTLLMVILSGMAPNPLNESTPEEDGRMARFVLLVTAATLFSCLALARTVEDDLKSLISFDSVVGTSIESLQPSRIVQVTWVAIGLVYGILFFPVLLSLGVPEEFTVGGTIVVFAAGWTSAIVGFVVMPLYGLSTGLLLMVIINQVASLVHAASHVKIDFLQLNDYAVIANPGVRLFLVYISLMSFLLPGLLFVEDATESAILLQLFAFFMSAGIIILLPYLYPVWLLRNRIRTKKMEKLDQVGRAMNGDKDALQEIMIQEFRAPIPSDDLLSQHMFLESRYMFLESRWEWPIATHLQKLILFGLLPPFTWVLAAMIENTMY